ncbi:class F sortase [Candidatus Saccharibacteria bacterium]|nr:class F sortase [Candidatus Saccharibacteria bacterium]
MALKMDWKKKLPQIITGIILLMLAIFLLRVAIWESDYYHRMEGAPRAVADSSTNAPTSSEEVDESDVTEQMKLAHKVAADRPRFLSIEKLGIDRARVIEVGVNNLGQLQTPVSIFDVGWFRGSGRPGFGGTMVIDGHNGGPTMEGVFKHLPELTMGDVISIERGDGKFFRYQVIDNATVPLANADEYMKTAMTTPEKGRESLTLITCTGEWSQVQQTYLSRQFVRAVLIESDTNYKETEIVNELEENRKKKEEEEKQKAAEEAAAAEAEIRRRQAEQDDNSDASVIRGQ